MFEYVEVKQKYVKERTASPLNSALPSSEKIWNNNKVKCIAMKIFMLSSVYHGTV